MRIYFIILVACLYAVPLPSSAGANDALAIIVSPDQTTKTLSKSELALIFWRKKLYWSNGKRIRPVNFSTENPVRNQFSKRVLGSTPDSQTDYWNGLYYHGVSPPHVLNSNEAVLRFVAETAGAIAYISACHVDDRIKVIAWLDSDGNMFSAPPAMDCAE